MPDSIIDQLAKVSLDQTRASLLQLPAGTLTLNRSWPRSAKHLHLEFIAEEGDIVPGQWMNDESELNRIYTKTLKLCPDTACAIIQSEGNSILLQPHGADRRLPGLAPSLIEPGMTLLVHRPERRAVVRRVSTDGIQFLKLLRPERTTEIAEAGRGMESAPGRPFAVPQIIDSNDEKGIIILSQLPGESLYDRLNSVSESVWIATGKMLRWLHDSSPKSNTPIHDATKECGVIDRWINLCCALTRNEPPCLQAHAENIKTALHRNATEPTALLHRDFYDKQVFVEHENNLGLLDFDTLSRGEAALDIANFLVHLELRTMQNRITTSAAETASSAFLQGYDPSSQVRQRIPPYLNATRIRLACVYSFRPAWSHLTPRLLDSLSA